MKLNVLLIPLYVPLYTQLHSMSNCRRVDIRSNVMHNDPLNGENDDCWGWRAVGGDLDDVRSTIEYSS